MTNDDEQGFANSEGVTNDGEQGFANSEGVTNDDEQGFANSEGMTNDDEQDFAAKASLTLQVTCRLNINSENSLHSETPSEATKQPNNFSFIATYSDSDKKNFSAAAVD